MKKKSLLLIIGLLVIALMVGCTPASSPKEEVEAELEDTEQDVLVLKVGATPVPHSEILEFIKPILLEKGIELEIVEFTDYNTPNLALADGGIDANFFQHVPYMESFAENNNLNLVSAAKVHLEPLGLYSNKIDNIGDLRDGAKISIPNDPTNGGRALLLLQDHGLIELKEDAPLTATEKDIVSNPKNLEFFPLEAPQLPRSLDDVDASIINTNYALEVDLNPVEDSLIIEATDSPYANIVTVLPENLEDERIITLVTVLTSPQVKDFIVTNYKGTIIPAF